MCYARCPLALKSQAMQAWLPSNGAASAAITSEGSLLREGKLTWFLMMHHRFSLKARGSRGDNFVDTSFEAYVPANAITDDHT